MESSDFVGLKALEAIYEMVSILEALNTPNISTSQRYIITKRLKALQNSLPYMPPGLKSWLRSKRRFKLDVQDEPGIEKEE